MRYRESCRAEQNGVRANSKFRPLPYTWFENNIDGCRIPFSRMVKCCKCNANGTCRNCACVKSGSTCTVCAPGEKDRCRNSQSRTGSDCSAVATHKSQPQSPSTAIHANELARGVIEAALKAVYRKTPTNGRRSEESSSSPNNDDDQWDGQSDFCVSPLCYRAPLPSTSPLCFRAPLTSTSASLAESTEGKPLEFSSDTAVPSSSDMEGESRQLEATHGASVGIDNGEFERDENTHSSGKGLSGINAASHDPEDNVISTQLLFSNSTSPSTSFLSDTNLHHEQPSTAPNSAATVPNASATEEYDPSALLFPDATSPREPICEAYDEVCHWKKSFFKIPNGSVGKSFVNEIARNIQEYVDSSGESKTALFNVFVLPALFLQKTSSSSRAKQTLNS